MTRKVLVLGATGMLGHTLMTEFAATDSLEVYGTARQVQIMEHAVPAEVLARVIPGLDGREPSTIHEVIKRLHPDVVVNCIGVIKQDSALSDRANTVALNSMLPHLLAEWCADSGARLIQISTDCVFSGKTGMYSEDDLPDPIDFYGLSKLVGEVVTVPAALTIRTSIIGHELEGQRSLLDWFLSQSGGVEGYTKAIYSGVTTVELARILTSVVFPREELHGLIHVASNPISKYELLGIIAKEYHWQGVISPSDRVDCDRSLSADAFYDMTGYRPPQWPEMIAEMRRSIAGSA